MRSSHIIIVLLAILSAIALVPSRAVVDDEQTLTMAVWGMPFEDMLFRDGYARDFERLNPGWTVRYLRHTKLEEKYKAWHVLGRGADVMRLRITDYHTFVAMGMLTPLDQFIDHPEIGLSKEEQSDFVEPIWEALEVDGARYALPQDNAQYGLYYNRALFDEYNAAHAADAISYPDADWTWNELRDAARKLTLRNQRGVIVQHGLVLDLWEWPFMAFFAQAGGELWNASGTRTLIDSPAGIEAMEFLASIIPPDAPVRSPDVAKAGTGPAELFALGKAAMLLDGSWRAPNLEMSNPDLDFAIAPLPRGKHRAIMAGAVLWGISAHSENPEKAWEMIKWMTSREQALRYWHLLRVAPPARVSVVASETFQETPGLFDGDGRMWVPPMSRDLGNLRAGWLRYAVVPHPETGEPPGFIPASRYQADLELKIRSAIIAVVRGGVSAKDALRRAAREVHEIIERDRRGHRADSER